MRHLGPGATTGGSGALHTAPGASGIGAHPVCSRSTVTATPSSWARSAGTSDAARARAAAATAGRGGAGAATNSGTMRRWRFSPAAVLAHPSTRHASVVCGGSSRVMMVAPCGDWASTAAAPHTSARTSTTARTRASAVARLAPAAASHATTTSTPRRSAGTSPSSTAAGPSQATVPGGSAAAASTGGSGTPTERHRRGASTSDCTTRDRSFSMNRTGSPPSVVTTMSNT